MNIRSHEFDEMARLGMAAARRVLTEDRPTEADREKTKLSLKYSDLGTRRMSAETNRASLGYKIAKETGLLNESITGDIVRQLTGASSDLKAKTPAPLAGSSATTSEEKAGDFAAKKGGKANRSRKAA